MMNLKIPTYYYRVIILLVSQVYIIIVYYVIETHPHTVAFVFVLIMISLMCLVSRLVVCVE